LVGISRLYLLQHFYEDVYAGAIVGMLISFVVYYGNEKWKNKRITI
jgi:membrane-associated phospholipid phosphatase